MERLLIVCSILFVQSSGDVLEAIVKRQADMDAVMDFTPQCSEAFTNINTKCMANMLGFLEAFKNVERQVMASWAEQCQGNAYDCITSPDQETDVILKYFKQLLPKVKDLCADGCMVPLIQMIHSCVKKDILAEIGISRSEMEEIFDLVCIQQDSVGGQEGEYCVIKAMTAAVYVMEAKSTQYCNLDDVKLDQCDQESSCTCSANCTALLTESSKLMGCCMGTLLELEARFQSTHPANDDLLNPGNLLFEQCKVTTLDSCKTSKDEIAEQELVYAECANTLKNNSISRCIDFDHDLHEGYLANMQNISSTCKESKNMGLCKAPSSQIQIDATLRGLLKTLSGHCRRCSAELNGIRENCVVYLPNEAKMVFQLLCTKNTDEQFCGPQIIEYEAARGRIDLDSNPCFNGYMSYTESQNCSSECLEEIIAMNRYGILNCFDALVRNTLCPKPEWLRWHKDCIVNQNVDVKDKILQYITEDGSWDMVSKQPPKPTRVVYKKVDHWVTRSPNQHKSLIVRTVGYTSIATAVLILVIVGVVIIIYKRQRLFSMMGYHGFRGGTETLITDVDMDMDTNVNGGASVYQDF